jgi:hypothetical protein
MITYFIHDSKFILDTREYMTIYFIHDSKCILDTREHMTSYFIHDSRFGLLCSVCLHHSCLQEGTCLTFVVCLSVHSGVLHDFTIGYCVHLYVLYWCIWNLIGKNYLLKYQITDIKRVYGRLEDYWWKLKIWKKYRRNVEGINIFY